MISSTPTALVAAAPTLLRQGLVATLRQHWPLLRIILTADATQIAELVQQESFGLLVLDEDLPGRALPDLLAWLQRTRPGQRLILLGDTPPRSHPIGAGPGYGGVPLRLPHQVPPHALVAALVTWLDAPVSQEPPARLPRRQVLAEPFSPRELQVLRLVMADQCNEEIADHLCVSVRTVESHRRTLLHKAGTRTLVGLVVRAVREGWVA
jgi:DNA-binding NarL/FixJ family response regulator